MFQINTINLTGRLEEPRRRASPSSTMRCRSRRRRPSPSACSTRRPTARRTIDPEALARTAAAPENRARMIPLDWNEIVKVRDQWNNRWRREVIAAATLSRGMSYLALAGPGASAIATPSRSIDVSLAVERASRSRCSARPAAARRRRCACSPGLIAPTGGTIQVGGARHHQRCRRIERNMGYVFQSYALFPHLSVARNVGFGLEERGLPRAEIDAARRRGAGAGPARRPRAAPAARTVGRPAAARRAGARAGDPARGAAARRIPVQPRRQAARRDAPRDPRDPAVELGITTLFVTHDQVEALTMCDRDRRDESRADRAGRLAGGDLRAPGDALRRRLRRPRQSSCRRRATPAGGSRCWGTALPADGAAPAAISTSSCGRSASRLRAGRGAGRRRAWRG